MRGLAGGDDHWGQGAPPAHGCMPQGANGLAYYSGLFAIFDGIEAGISVFADWPEGIQGYRHLG